MSRDNPFYHPQYRSCRFTSDKFTGNPFHFQFTKHFSKNINKGLIDLNLPLDVNLKRPSYSLLPRRRLQLRDF